MDFLFGLGAAILVLVFAYTAFPTLTVVAGIGIAVYFIYNVVLGSKWLATVERTSKTAAEQRKVKQKLDTLKKDWEATDWHVPTMEEFATELAKYAPHELHSSFLANITNTQCWIYYSAYLTLNAKETSVAHAKRLYEMYLHACVQGMKDFAAVLPLKETQNTSPFMYTTTIDPNTYAPLYRELAETLDRDEFKKYLFPHMTMTIDAPDGNPGSLKDAYINAIASFSDEDCPSPEKIKREWERDKKAYDKIVEKRREILTPLDLAVENTPYWRGREDLVPTEVTNYLTIPYKERFAGTWIIAPSGQGKTNLMWWLIDEDRKRRGTVVIMDSKGTLLNSYKGYANAVILDARTTRINPFQIGKGDQAIDFIEYIFSLISVSMTEKQQSLFYPVLRLVTRVPNGSLDTFKKILVLGWREMNLAPYVAQCDQNTREFFTLAKQGGVPAFDQKQYDETKEQLLWRFALFLSKPAMQHIFSATESNVDFFELLDSGKTILINNNVNDLGPNGAEFLGRFFLALTWMKAITRTEIPDDKKIPVFFYIDEAQTVIANDAKVPTILDECRSQMIALTIAHQRLNRITATEVKDALFNCPVRFASVDNDASLIAHRFPGLTPQELQLPPHNFACYVRGQTPKAVTFNVGFFDLSQFPPYEAPAYEPEPEPEPVVITEPLKKKQKPFKKDRRAAINRQEIEDF